MTKNRLAILLILISIPLMWWGFNQFIYGSGHSTLEAIAVSLSCTGGLSCLIGGIYMFFTKEKGRGEILASQTSKDSPIQKTINKPSKKVKKMAKAETSVDLMKREKELETRRKELESLLAEVTFEESVVETQLLEKGWVQKNGSWGIK